MFTLSTGCCGARSCGFTRGNPLLLRPFPQHRAHLQLWFAATYTLKALAVEARALASPKSAPDFSTPRADPAALLCTAVSLLRVQASPCDISSFADQDGVYHCCTRTHLSAHKHTEPPHTACKGDSVLPMPRALDSCAQWLATSLLCTACVPRTGQPGARRLIQKKSLLILPIPTSR